MVEVEGLEGLLQIEGRGGEDDDAEHGVVIQTVPGAVASISDPEAKILRCLTLSFYHAAKTLMTNLQCSVYVTEQMTPTTSQK